MPRCQALCIQFAARSRSASGSSAGGGYGQGFVVGQPPPVENSQQTETHWVGPAPIGTVPVAVSGAPDSAIGPAARPPSFLLIPNQGPFDPPPSPIAK